MNDLRAGAPIPRRIEWAGPEGWSVWADEDGVHLRAPGGKCLEAPDVRRLFELWSAAVEAMSNGGAPAPERPSREAIAAMGGLRSDAYARRRARRAIDAEFGDDDETPF